MVKRYTKEEFIKKAQQVHGNKYSYDQVEYIDYHTPIKILCNRCKKYFMQKPCNHINGSGCYKCSLKEGAIPKKLTIEQFLKRAKDIHGDKYDYTEVTFSKNRDKIKIYCKKCKDYFFQYLTNHLKGCNCPRCAIKTKRTRSIGTAAFIERAKKIHGNSYDYSKVIYKTEIQKVILKCNKCGHEFEQAPEKHLYGQGCPYCRQSKGERAIKKFLNDNTIEYKIQYWFKDCRDINPLPFDFYIPKLNLCIEYQGRQHYEIVRHSKRESLKKLEEDFELRQLHDEIKRKYCKEHGIKLLEIRYDESIVDRLKGIIE